MGLLKLLFGSSKTSSKVAPPLDLIYLTEAAKFRAVERTIRERALANSASIILVGHLGSTMERLLVVADESEHETMAVRGNTLSPDVAASMNFDTGATVDLIVAERHPLPAGDQFIMDFAEALQCRSRITHVLSLDDTIMKVFAGDFVKQMMSNLGMGEDEAAESKLVARRMKSAQQAIEKKMKACLLYTSDAADE